MDQPAATPGTGNGKVIAIVVVAIIVVILVIVAIVSSNKKKRQAELEQQAMMLQAQINNPNTPDSTKQNLIGQLTNLLGAINQVKQGVTPPKTTPPATSKNLLTWDGGGSGVCGNPATLNRELMLKNGSKGPEVCALQSYLNTRGAGLVVDGVFGTKTQTALKNVTGLSAAPLASVILS